MSPKLWCEARCVGIYDHATYGCRETSEGTFGAQSAARAARAQGWRVSDGEWLCPNCIRRRALEKKEGKDDE